MGHSEFHLLIYPSTTCWWARATPLKNMSSSFGMMKATQMNGKIKLMATKPPTRIQPDTSALSKIPVAVGVRGQPIGDVI